MLPTYVDELAAIEALFELRTNVRVNSTSGENSSSTSDTQSENSRRTSDSSAPEDPTNAPTDNANAEAVATSSTNDDSDPCEGPSTSSTSSEEIVPRRELDAIAGLLEFHTCDRVHNKNDDQTPASSSNPQPSNETASDEATITTTTDEDQVTTTTIADLSDPCEGPSTLLMNQPSTSQRIQHNDDINRNTTLCKRKQIRNLPVIVGYCSSDSDATISDSEETESDCAYYSTKDQSTDGSLDATIENCRIEHIKNQTTQLVRRVLRFSNRLYAQESNSEDMVPIGPGRTLVPASLYRHIDWQSYTTATRKLLSAVFSRQVLATHSLTGKASNAFPSKPAKAQLNVTQVNDIVQEVVRRCGVSESLVRTSITTKCADESKMYRNRQENQQKKRRK